MVQFFSQNKGQVFSTDFVVSAVVFGLIASIFIFSWNTMVEQQSANINEKERFKTGQSMVNTLITRSTNNWTDDQFVGLATKPYILNYSKIKEFKSLNSTYQASLLQTSNFSLNINTKTKSIQIGSRPNGSYALPFRRDLTMEKNGSRIDAQMELIIWG